MATPTETAIQRAMQAYGLLLGESCGLDWGVAFTSTRFPRIASGNQLREVMVGRAEELPMAFESVEAYFAERGARCLRWSPAVDQPVDALAPFLADRGFDRDDYSLMTVREWVDVPSREGVRVLPARAMPKALSAILRQRHADAGAELVDARVDAERERLDEARIEGFVAVCEGEAVGWCSFFEVGDIGVVTDLFVASDHRRRGVGTTLMSHALKLAKRLMMRVTCVRVGVAHSGACALFQRCGLETDGSAVEFVRV